VAKKRKTDKESPRAPAPDAISKRGWKIIGAGAGAVLLGFIVLSKVDPMGRNWAADVSPLLILGGYALIGLGIFADAPKEGGETPPSAPPAQP
jgi:hypothetical protein